MLAIALTHLFANERIIPAPPRRRKLQPQRRVVFFVYLYAFDPLQLLDAALHLNGFCGFVSKPFDKIFRIFNLLLLILVRAKLLFATLFAQYDRSEEHTSEFPVTPIS